MVNDRIQTADHGGGILVLPDVSAVGNAGGARLNALIGHIKACAKRVAARPAGDNDLGRSTDFHDLLKARSVTRPEGLDDSPTYFAFGKGRENEAGALVKRFGGSRALVLYGGGSAVRSGLLEQVTASLKESGVEAVVLGGVKPNPESDLVYEGVSLCRENALDFVLAVGGGSVIDTAKAVAVGALYAGDFWEFFDYAVRRPITEALPVGTVLTIAATGSEASTDAVISADGGKLKRSISSDLIRPVFSILNPELTCTLPAYQTACGIVDMFAHVLERYFTNTTEVGLTDGLCESVMRTIIYEAGRVMEDPTSYDARADLMWAGTIAHNNILGTGREQDWGSHLIEHELSAKYGCAHGAGLAVVFPAWMKYVVGHDPARFTRWAVNVWGCEEQENVMDTAMDGIGRYEAFLASLGMPRTLGDVGGKAEDIPELAVNVGSGPYQFGNFVKLGIPETTEILKLAL